MTTRSPDAEPLLTPAEVAALFRVDPKTVTRWAKAGKLSSIRTLGGHRRYRESEVRALLAGIPQQRLDEDCLPRRAPAPLRCRRPPVTPRVRRGADRGPCQAVYWVLPGYRLGIAWVVSGCCLGVARADRHQVSVRSGRRSGILERSTASWSARQHRLLGTPNCWAPRTAGHPELLGIPELLSTPN
jgi:excisionase family DNA binding protein